MHDDPIQGLLQAGSLREQADRLQGQAELHERMALQQLEEREGIRPGVHTTQLNSVLVLAYGGPANGVAVRVPISAFPHNVTIAVGASLFEYAPGVLIAIGSAVPCALVVPKVGGLAAMYRDAQAMGQDAATGAFDALSQAVTRMVLLGLGYHQGLTYMPAQQLAQAARNPEVVLESPAVINLQGAAA
jgi:hypothetical protein